MLTVFNFLKLAQISKGHICPVTNHYTQYIHTFYNTKAHQTMMRT